MNTSTLPKDSQHVQVQVKPINWDRLISQQEQQERTKALMGVALSCGQKMIKPIVERSIEKQFPDMEKEQVKEFADICTNETKNVIKKGIDKSIESDLCYKGKQSWIARLYGKCE